MATKVTVFLALAAAALVLPLAAGARPAPAGSIVFTSDRANGDRELYVVNTDGSGLRRLTFNSLFERQAAWSPDRTHVAFSALDQATGNWDIYSIDSSGGDLRRLTKDPGRDDSPQWTADGRIVYQHESRTWIVGADGSGAAELPTGPGDALTPTASPKGSTIAFSSNRGGPTWAIYTMGLDGKGARQVTFPSAGQDVQPRFSPNGNDIAFMRDSGTQDNDLYVVHLNGGQLTRLTFTPDRTEFWSSWSGSDIVFSAFGANGAHLYTEPSTGGVEKRVSTWPQAPFDETFDTPLDSGLWHTISDPGGSVAPSGGRLVASISGTAVPGGQFNQVDEHIGSQCNLNGDFDYQVDYSLLVWPDFGGFFAQLSAFFADGSVARQSNGFSPPWNQQYSAFMTGGGGSFTTTDTSGTFRLVRTGGTMYAYVRSTSVADWRLVASGSAPGSTVFGMGLWAPANSFNHMDGSVAYDNFRLNSGALTCPSWWDDLAPDVS